VPESFFALPYDQQIAALQAAAESCLPEYDLGGAVLDLLAYQSNAVFSVRHSGQPVAALRLYRPEHKPLAQIHSELVLLRHLNESGLPVPQPIAADDGAPLTFARISGLGDPLPVALFAWREGAGYTPDDLPESCARTAGTRLAELHAALDAFVPPPAFARPTLDADGLFGERSPYHSTAGSAIFTDAQQAVFTAIEARVSATMKALVARPRAFGLIHADFIPKNLLFAAADSVIMLDFEDCAFGYRLYDLAPALWQFKATPRYSALRGAFLNGYTAAQSLADADLAHLETFIAARQVASCRWLAANQHNPRIREIAPELIASRSRELAHFLEHGRFGSE
jgi:Ser/Thr protein kinase RdoA (MazF antagonist)